MRSQTPPLDENTAQFISNGILPKMSSDGNNALQPYAITAGLNDKTVASSQANPFIQQPTPDSAAQENFHVTRSEAATDILNKGVSFSPKITGVQAYK